MRHLLKLLLFIPFLSFAQAETPAQANKKLFDRTIDELNFRTFETVYDKHFTRQKYPAALRTAAARREFSNFENNTELQKLFLNYNSVAERFKTHFGGGQLSQAEFEKQLNGVVRDRNFEFFIRGLPRDERSALIRTEQRIIKQAVARFNASGETAANVPAAETDPEPAMASAPLTTNGPAPEMEATPAATSPSEPELRGPVGETAPATGPGWVGYLTLLASLSTLGLVGFALLSVLPELRRLQRRVRELETAPHSQYNSTAYADSDSDLDQEPAEPRPGFLSRLRGSATGELPTDSYDDDEPDPHYSAQ